MRIYIIFNSDLIPKRHTNYKVRENADNEPYYVPKPEYVYITYPQDVYEAVKSEMFADRETFVALYLNTKNRVIKKEVVSFGSLNANVVHPREVYKEAILNSAASVIVSHNHPSGDPTPSREDLEITEKLYQAGNIIGINLLDHVIIGEGGYFYSMKERGHLK